MKKQINIFITLFILSINATLSQVTANFTSNDSIGCNILSVQFINLSVNIEGQTYIWDFGNGSTSTLENPRAAYTSPGIYTVTLIVFLNELSDTLIRQNYIKVYNNPTASFVSNENLLGCVPIEINLENNSSIGDTLIISQVWDFGDGGFSDLFNGNHIYQNSGNYTVILTVTDANGCSSNFFIPDLIQVKEKPVINFTANVNKTCNDSLLVQFTNLTELENQMQFEWQFGGSNSSSDINPQQLFIGYGNYDVQLKATNSYGCIDSLVKHNFIVLQLLSASITINEYNYCKYQEIDITNNTLGATNHYWNFGDSTFSNSAMPKKYYNDGGKFIVEYIASFENYCTDTIVDSVFIDPIEALFSNSQNYICELPLTVDYINQSINAVSWHWILGNGAISDVQNPQIVFNSTPELEHKYQAFYNDTLIVTSSLNCTDTLALDSNISVILPKIYFTPNDSSSYENQTSGCLPLTIDFNDKSIRHNPEDAFVQWFWDFNDGTNSELANPTHFFTEEGIYKVNLKVTSESGCENEYSSIFKTGTPQNASFSMVGDSVVCGSQAIQFINNSSIDSLIDGWTWLFSDGIIEHTQNPLHVFTDTGYMSVSLTVFDKGCLGTTMFIDSIIKIKAPAGNFSYLINCESPFNYEFTSNVYGADSLIWSFGDGISDSTNSVQLEHNYLESNDFNVNFKTYNLNTGCDLELNLPVFVRKLNATFNYYPKNNCINDTIYFDASASEDVGGFFFNGQFGSFLWDFGDLSNNFDTITLGDAYYVFDESGLFNITLKVKDVNNCWQETDTTFRIYEPKADFITDYSYGCLPLQVKFTNNTQGDTTISSWQWSFGDGNSSFYINPIHTYNDTGWFSVQLAVADTLGCTDTLKVDSAILISKPQPSFKVDKANICLGDTISFSNNSTGNDISFQWDFGDGDLSNLINPIHLYSDSGLYNVSLYVIDTLGCDSLLSIQNFINVQSFPVADFDADFNSLTCYPALIKFQDKSISNYINIWKWSFGDESTASGTSTPLHNYFLPGNFDVKLLVKTNFGCTDSILKNSFIHIGGPYADIIANDSACINEPNLITMENKINIYNYFWKLDDGTTYFQDTIFPEYNSSGQKYISLYLYADSIGTCNKVIENSIFIPNIIADFWASDSVGCEPLTVELIDSSIGVYNSYWNFGNTDSSNISGLFYTYEKDGIYNLKLLVENQIGCKDSVFKKITVFPLPEIQVSNDTVLCKNDTIHIYALGGESYYWNNNNFINNNIVENPLVYPNSDMFFYVTIIDSNNCVNNDSVFIHVQQIPIATINNADTIEIIIGESVNLNALDTLANEIFWSPEDYLSCIYCSNPQAIPLENIMYHYLVKDENNCFKASDSVYIRVKKKFSIDLPNAFTPNNDGVNDIVYIKGWGIKELIEFKIFDVFGKEIFSSNSIYEGWDGTKNGIFLPIGNYYYYIKVLNYDNKIRIKQGSIYLIR